MAALVGMASNLRTILAPHVAFKLMDGGRLWPAHDVQSHGLVRVATKAANLKIEVSGVQGVAKRRGRLRRSFVSKHTLVPCLARQPVSFLARFLGAFGRSPDGSAINAFARLGAHRATMPLMAGIGKPLPIAVDNRIGARSCGYARRDPQGG
jgi:hypothetical protein